MQLAIMQNEWKPRAGFPATRLTTIEPATICSFFRIFSVQSNLSVFVVADYPQCYRVRQPDKF